MYSDALARVATRCAAAAVSSVIDLCRLHRISLGRYVLRNGNLRPQRIYIILKPFHGKPVATTALW